MSEGLTKQQKEAVEYLSSPLLIVAGPGTGKTKVITQKVIYLVKEKNVNPSKILVSTFTIKAAEQLKDRIRKELGNKVENMQISTIHSFCQTMLEEFSDFHRLGSTFNVIDEEGQYIFVKSKYAFQFKLKDHIQPFEVSSLINTYNKLSENNVNSLEFIDYYTKKKVQEKTSAIVESYDKYLIALQNENLIDFANLQKEFLFLLESNENIKKIIQEKYDYILIDEYQDTNPIQDKIFSLISTQKNNICVVGDEDQSIYGFRGASIENFRSFPDKYNNTKIITLEENFRSCEEIVKFTNNFIKDYRKYPKNIYSHRKKQNQPILIRGKSITDEAKQTIEFIKNLKKENKIKHYGDIAILFRSVRNHSYDYTQYLKEANIPYYVIGDGAFLSREEVRTILYLMAFCEGFQPTEKNLKEWIWWNNNLLFNKVLDLSIDTKKKLQSHIFVDDFIKKINYNFLKSRDIEKKDLFMLIRLVDKKEEVMKEGEKRKKYSLTQLFYDILKRTDYFRKINEINNEDFEIQRYNLGLLSNIIYKFETTTHNNNFKSFFDHLFYLPDDKSPSSAFIENTDAVKLMTIHQAKGLEFPVVIMGSVTKGRFPSKSAKKEDDFFIIPTKFLLYNQKRDPLEEERRLFYVGMTRAQDLLVISTSDGEGKKPSEYIIDEIGINNFGRSDISVNECDNTYEKLKEIPRLSYSSINNFLSCPFRYSLNYKYKFQTPPTFFQNYGIIVHNSLQKIHLDMKIGKIIDLERLKEITKTCWIPIYFDKLKDEKMMYELVEKLWNYVRKGTKNYKEILDVEKPFSFIGKDFIIRGKVDLITKDMDNSINITDFKSRNVEGVEKTMVDTQLRMYNLALEHEYNINKIYAYTFLDNMRTPFENKREKLEETKALIIKVGTDIKNEQFPKNLKSKFCKTCLYGFLCY